LKNAGRPCRRGQLSLSPLGLGWGESVGGGTARRPGRRFHQSAKSVTPLAEFRKRCRGQQPMSVTFAADDAEGNRWRGTDRREERGQTPHLDEEEEDWGVEIEYCDQGNSGCDCIKACVLGRDRLDVELSEPIDPGKEIDGFHIELALSDEQWRSLAAGLRVVF